MKPLAIDLFCGLGGWTDGLLLEGWEVVGFDIERHDYGTGGYPAQLVLQDVLTLHGSQFKDVDLIVASPPCQAYSYRAMPWKRAKALPPPDNSLFEACFRIQAEAIEAAGRFIPLVVENVRGAQKWVGRSVFNFGSFHIWGNVPALMPRPISRMAKVPGMNWSGSDKPGYKAIAFNDEAIRQTKNTGGSWFAIAHNKTSGHSRNPVTELAGMKGPNGCWFNDKKRQDGSATGYLSRSGSKSLARKAASAQIAKIPLPLSRHIGRVYFPQRFEEVSA